MVDNSTYELKGFSFFPGTMIPKSGGDYAYISEAFGPLAGFLYLWMALIVIMPAGNAIIALTFANYILQPFWPECDPPKDAIRLLAACVICKSISNFIFKYLSSLYYVIDLFFLSSFLTLSPCNLFRIMHELSCCAWCLMDYSKLA